MDFFETVDKRRSIRKFKKKIIEEAKVTKILETSNSAPSAGNSQSYEIFVLRDDKIKEAVSSGCFRQPFIADASLLLVFCTNNERSKYGERGEKLYSVQDATIACTYAQLAATSLGLGSVWIGSFDPEKIKIMIKTKLEPVAVLPIGYPDESPGKTSRRKLAEIVHDVG